MIDVFIQPTKFHQSEDIFSHIFCFFFKLIFLSKVQGKNCKKTRDIAYYTYLFRLVPLTLTSYTAYHDNPSIHHQQNLEMAILPKINVFFSRLALLTEFFAASRSNSFNVLPNCNMMGNQNVN